MPRRKVVLNGFLAFGAGVAVGANWPRASNFVGYILQRLGFELTDLTLWMWDPEKSAIGTPETTLVRGPKVKKRSQAPRIRADNSAGKKKTRPKAETTAPPPRTESGAPIIRATRKKAANGHEPWTRPDKMNGSTARTNGRNVPSALIQPRNGVRTTPKRAAVNSKQKSPAARLGGKISKLPSPALPADAALN